MSNTSDDTLVAEIDQAIEDIREKDGMQTCDAHNSMSRGLIVLLRCQRAQLNQVRGVWLQSGLISAIVTGLVIGVTKLCL